MIATTVTVTDAMKKYVAYYRVSTDLQGKGAGTGRPARHRCGLLGKTRRTGA